MYVASDGIHTAVISRVDYPENPRNPDFQDNLGRMICWHRRYNLGDSHDFEDVQAFFEHLASKYLDNQDLFRALTEGKIESFRLENTETQHPSASKTQTYALLHNHKSVTGTEDWRSTGWTANDNGQFYSSNGETIDDLLSSFTTRELEQLVNSSKKIAILPLYLYDHSGISMSTGSFLGRAVHAEWDSGQVGYIYMDKDRALTALSYPADEVQVISPIMEEPDKRIHIKPGKSEDLSHAAKIRGFSPVEKKNLVMEAPYLYTNWMDGERLYKRGSTLYLLEEGEQEGTFHPRAVASLKQEYQRLNEHNWRERAIETLKDEVSEYDNYLTNDVYCIRCFDGFDEVNCMGDYYPGKSILTHCFDDLLDGWHPELAEQFHSYDTEDFQIEDYLEENEFSEYRNALSREVEAILDTVNRPYPFALTKSQILENQDGVLDEIVDQLYQAHTMPEPATVIQAIADTAGLSREVVPRLRSTDLLPGQDYTAEELTQLLQKKTCPLDEIIQSASGKIKDHPRPEREVSFHLQDR